jgi:hypothetical protein
MAEENAPEEAPQEPVKKYKYNLDLGPNRGSTVVKYTREEAAKVGLSDEDMVDGQDVGPVVETKAATPKNKAKHAANK